MSTVTIAPHLQRALEAMSKDMAVEPQALVNQAVFAWLRINGYVTPGAATALAAPTDAPAAPPVVAPVVAPVVVPVIAPVAPPVASVAALEVEAPAPAAAAAPGSARSLPPVSSTPTPAPVAPPAAAPVTTALLEAKKPEPDTSAARARMAEIAADLERLTRPWPEWTKSEEEGDEEEEEALDDSEDSDEEEAQASGDEEEGDQEEAEEQEAPPEEQDEEAPRAAAEPELDANTGETEVAPPEEEEPPAESTVVLRSVPIVLYLEREGEEPVRMTAERFIIGRGPQCDLIIDSPRVSREHLAVTRQGVRYFIEDLNSSNGTWLGEERISTRELESGDVINLGNEPVTFWLRGE